MCQGRPLLHMNKAQKNKMTHQYISESTLYVVFDLETTEPSRMKDKIIETLAKILDDNSQVIPILW